MKPKNKLRFLMPLTCLWLFSLSLTARTHKLLTAPFIGLAAFLLVQLLYNVSWHSHHSDRMHTLERMTADQLNDPGLGSMAARDSNRGGTFMPTRDIRATDMQRTTAGSWLIVTLTLLGTIAEADPLLNPGPMTLSNYRIYFLLLIIFFLLERILLQKRK